MASHNVRDSILGLLILAAPVALVLTVDEDLLVKLAFVALVIGAAGVIGLRQYLVRVNNTIGALAGLAAPATVPMTLLEQRLLGIEGLTHPERIQRALRSSSARIVNAGLGFGVCALIGFIVLVVIHAY